MDDTQGKKKPLISQTIHEYWNSAQKPGYAGTAILVSEKLAQPTVTNGLGKAEYDGMRAVYKPLNLKNFI